MNFLKITENNKQALFHICFQAKCSLIIFVIKKNKVTLNKIEDY